MFIGTFKHQLDEKNRVRMPAKLKKELAEGFIITKGTNGCLFVLGESEMKNLYTKIENISMFDEEAQKPLRILFSSAFDAEEDNQGRILLPQNLLEYASINKNIYFIGVGNRVEIWAEEKWNEYYGNSNFDTASKELKNRGV